MKRSAFVLMALSVASCDPMLQDDPSTQPADEGGDHSGAGPKAVEPEGEWEVVPGASAGYGGPGGAIFRGRRWLTFTGTDRRINLADQRDDGRWVVRPQTYQTLGGSTLCVFNDELFLAWVGPDGHAYVRKSRDGFTWFVADRVVAGDYTDLRDSNRFAGDPALVVYGDTLNMFLVENALYADVPDLGHILQWLYVGGAEWRSGDRVATDHISRSPSAAQLGDDLVVLWMGGDQRSIHTRKFIPGSGWGDRVRLDWRVEGHLVPVQGGAKPSLLFLTRETGAGERNSEIFIHRTFDGVTFDWVKDTGHASYGRPFVLEAGEHTLDIAHTGRDRQRSLISTTMSY